MACQTQTYIENIVKKQAKPLTGLLDQLILIRKRLPQEQKLLPLPCGGSETTPYNMTKGAMNDISPTETGDEVGRECVKYGTEKDDLQPEDYILESRPNRGFVFHSDGRFQNHHTRKELLQRAAKELWISMDEMYQKNENLSEETMKRKKAEAIRKVLANGDTSGDLRFYERFLVQNRAFYLRLHQKCEVMAVNTLDISEKRRIASVWRRLDKQASADNRKAAGKNKAPITIEESVAELFFPMITEREAATFFSGKNDCPAPENGYWATFSENYRVLTFDMGKYPTTNPCSDLRKLMDHVTASPWIGKITFIFDNILDYYGGSLKQQTKPEVYIPWFGEKTGKHRCKVFHGSDLSTAEQSVEVTQHVSFKIVADKEKRSRVEEDTSNIHVLTVRKTRSTDAITVHDTKGTNAKKSLEILRKGMICGDTKQFSEVVLDNRDRYQTRSAGDLTVTQMKDICQESLTPRDDEKVLFPEVFNVEEMDANNTHVSLYPVDVSETPSNEALFDGFRETALRDLLLKKRYCLYRFLPKQLEASYGPLLIVASPGGVTTFHQDAGGFLAAFHLVISGLNEVYFWPNTLAEEDVRKIRKQLLGREEELEPHEETSDKGCVKTPFLTNAFLAWLDQNGLQRPVMILLKPGMMILLARNQYHAFRKADVMRQLAEGDAFREIRKEFVTKLHTENRIEEFCCCLHNSMAWDLNLSQPDDSLFGRDGCFTPSGLSLFEDLIEREEALLANVTAKSEKCQALPRTVLLYILKKRGENNNTLRYQICRLLLPSLARELTGWHNLFFNDEHVKVPKVPIEANQTKEEKKQLKRKQDRLKKCVITTKPPLVTSPDNKDVLQCFVCDSDLPFLFEMQSCKCQKCVGVKKNEDAQLVPKVQVACYRCYMDYCYSTDKGNQTHRIESRIDDLPGHLKLDDFCSWLRNQQDKDKTLLEQAVQVSEKLKELVELMK